MKIKLMYSTGILAGYDRCAPIRLVKVVTLIVDVIVELQTLLGQHAGFFSNLVMPIVASIA
jgi:hypothetical protein